MAGHRKAKDRPPRQVPGARARGRLSTAATSEEQLAAAYDLFRVSARRRPALMRRAAALLVGLSNGDGDGYGE